MENKVSFKSIMLTYGLYLGIASVILAVANYSFGNIYKPHWAVNTISYLLMIALIVLGLKAFKDHNNGFLKLGQAIKLGVGIALISGILGAIYFFVFSSYIEPDFSTKMADFQEQMMLEKFPDMDEAIIEQQLEMSRKFMSPGIMAGMAVVVNIIMGLIISLIAGLIMKKEETEF
jgi:hypothetical protein